WQGPLDQGRSLCVAWAGQQSPESCNRPADPRCWAFASLWAAFGPRVGVAIAGQWGLGLEQAWVLALQPRSGERSRRSPFLWTREYITRVQGLIKGLLIARHQLAKVDQRDGLP